MSPYPCKFSDETLPLSLAHLLTEEKNPICSPDSPAQLSWLNRNTTTLSAGVHQKGGLLGPPPVVPTQNPSPPRRPTLPIQAQRYCPGRLRPTVLP